MNPWPVIGVLSALTGAVCGFCCQGRKAVFLGAAVPWVGFLLWLLYGEFFVPDPEGGASFWPIAQLLGGSFAALVGALAAAGVRYLRRRA